MKLMEAIEKLTNNPTSENTSNECDNCFVGHYTQHRSNWHSITERQRLVEKYCNQCVGNKEKK